MFEYSKSTSFLSHSPQTSLFGWDGDKNVRYATVTKTRTYSTGGQMSASNYNDDRDEIIAGVNSIVNAQIAEGADIEADKIADTALTQTATQTATNKTFTSPKIGTAILDTNGNEIIKTPATTSAVNEVTLTNAATGNAPVLSATGDDTNIALKVIGKGTGFTVITSRRKGGDANNFTSGGTNEYTENVLIQCGAAASGGGAPNTAVITFPTAFAAGSTPIVLSTVNSSTVTATSISTVNASGVTIAVDGSTARTVAWIAIGRSS